MKVDIDISNRKVGAGFSARRLPAILIGWVLLSSVARADDIASGLVDPTRPSYVGNASAGVTGSRYADSGPALQSTFVSTSRRLAVINGKSYAVGDRFGGAKIADIQPYEVVLERGGRETRLRLLPKLAKEATVVKVPANSQEGGKK
jgi:hypothetical protein